MVDEFELYRGKDLIVNDKLKIHQPTLEEICDFGEKKYYGMVSSLTATPNDFKSKLFDSGVDYEEISEFEFFTIIVRSIKLENSRILFGDTDFSQLDVGKRVKDDDVVLYNNETGLIIDKIIYTIMTDYLRTMHMLKKNVDRAGTPETKAALINEDRQEIRRSQNKPYQSMLVNLVSSLTNHEGFKYRYDDVWNLPIYVFMNSVLRIQKIDNYKNLMQGLYSGAIVIKDNDDTRLNWMGGLE